MDLGLGDLIIKFEEYFGKFFTAFLLAALGLAAFATALNFIWKFIGASAYSFLVKNGWSYELLLNAITTIIFVLSVTNFSYSYVAAKVARRELHKSVILVKKSKNLQKLARELHEETKASYQEIGETTAASKLLIEAAAQLLRSQGIIGKEQADNILSLLSNQEKTDS